MNVRMYVCMYVCMHLYSHCCYAQAVVVLVHALGRAGEGG